MPDLKKLLSRLRPGQLPLELFDTLTSASFFIKDSKRRFVTGNTALALGLGKRSIDEIVGKTDHELIADFLADAFAEDDQGVLLHGRSIVNKTELVPIRGNLEWQVTTKLPLYAWDESIVGLIGITRRIEDSDAALHDHPELAIIVNFIQKNYMRRASITEMARLGGISKSTLERLFRKSFGITPGQYVRKTRLNAACRLISEDHLSLGEVAERCGFKDQTYMSHTFRSILKLTPSEYRRRYGSFAENSPPHAR